MSRYSTRSALGDVTNRGAYKVAGGKAGAPLAKVGAPAPRPVSPRPTLGEQVDAAISSVASRPLSGAGARSTTPPPSDALERQLSAKMEQLRARRAAQAASEAEDDRRP